MTVTMLRLRHRKIFTDFNGSPKGLLFSYIETGVTALASKRIQGITVEIGGDTSKLTAALKDVDKSLSTTQSNLRDVNKLLKLDPGNTELLAQKHRLLGDAVRETKERLETLKTAASQANEALAKGEISQNQYDALQREIIETEEKLKSLESQASQSAVAIQKIGLAGENLQTLGSNITNVGTKLMPVSGAVTALGYTAVKTAADFDSAMSQVAAVSGATGDDLEALREKAREMGEKTKFSATEAAEAMNYMAMAGWKTSDMLNGIEGIMNLAAASGEDLATTSDIVTDALTAFGLTAADSGHFADILAAASSNANTNVSMMGETFKYCAPIAGALGFSAEDTAEAIGLMANAGIKSTQAGTAMRTMMNNLAGEVKFSGAAFGEMTVQTVNADGSMRGLNEILADCRVAFSQMSESEKAANAEMLVGKNAMSGFLAVMNAAPSDIEKLNTAITNCDGSAGDMAATMQDNLAGQLTILMSQLQELAISFGEMLMPIIRDVVTWIQNLVDKLNSMDEGTRSTILKIGLFVAALGPVLTVVGKVISAIGTILTIVPKVASAFGAVKTAFTALSAVFAANPIGLVIAAVAALIAIFVSLWNNCEGFREFWINLWQGIKDFFVGIWSGIQSVVSSVTDFIKNNWQSLFLFLVNPVAGFFKLLWDNCEGFREFWLNLWEGIKNVCSSAWSGICSLASSAWSGITQTVSSAWSSIKSGVSSAASSVENFVRQSWSSIKSNTSEAWSNVKQGVSSAWQNIQSGTSQALSNIKNSVSEGWSRLKENTSQAWSSMKENISQTWSNIKDGVSSAASSVKETVSNAWAATKENTAQKWSEIKDTVSNISSSIKDAVSNFGENVKNIASNLWESVKGTFQSGLNFVHDLATNKLSSLVENAKNFFSNMVSDTKSRLEDMKNGFSSAFSNIVSGVSNAVGNIQNALSNVFSSIKNVFSNIISNAFSWGKDIIGNLISGITSKIGNLVSSVKNIASTIWDYLHFSEPDKGPLSDFHTYMPDMIDLLSKGIEGNLHKLTGPMTDLGNMLTPMTGTAGAESTGGNTATNTAKMDAMSDTIIKYLPKLAGAKIVLDSGVLVGELSDGLNRQLGRAYL